MLNNHGHRVTAQLQLNKYYYYYYYYYYYILEIHVILTETLGEHAPPYATVKNLVAQFKRGDFSKFLVLVGLRTYQHPVNRLRAGRTRNCGPNPARSKTPRPTEGPTQPQTQCVPGDAFPGSKRLAREAGHLHPSSTGFKNIWGTSPFPPL
jgi:hypothetical protein